MYKDFSFLSLCVGLFLGSGNLYAQPVNDDPCGAIVLSVNQSGFYCPVAYTATNQDATNTTVVPAPLCSSGNADVWYKFVATATAHRITRSEPVPVTSPFINPGISVYSSAGGLCTSLSEIVCNAASTTTNLTGLTVGGTYYLRLWTANTTTDPAFSIDLCIGSSPSVPPNDACANAIPLDNGQPNYQYTNNATESFPAHDCGWGISSTGALDVWYTFTAASTGPVDLTAWGYESYINLEVYNNCSGSTLITCTDEPVGLSAPLPLTVNAVAGNTYYVRLYGREGSGYMGVQASGTPLPMHFINLEGKTNELGQVLLDWRAQGENYDFRITRSSDGLNFKEIAFIEYSNRTNFHYVDNSSDDGVQFYRLTGRDRSNGNEINSNIVQVQSKAIHQAIKIYPNPTTNVLNISLSNKNGDGILTIENLAGQVIQTIYPKSNLLNLDVSSFPAQLYLIRYANENAVSISKFIKND